MPDDTYELARHGRRYACVLRAEADAVLGALLDGKNCVAAEDVGRAAVAFFPLKSGEGVLRQFRRGGLIAKFCKDGFLGTG